MASRETNGVAIRELRKAYGISQADLARSVGVDKSQICRLEAGAQVRSFETVRKIADRLGVPLDAITTSAPDLLKPADVCKVLSVTHTEYLRLVREGDLAGTRLGVSEKALEEYIARRLPERAEAAS